jgi:hypothetical protein
MCWIFTHAAQNPKGQRFGTGLSTLGGSIQLHFE